MSTIPRPQVGDRYATKNQGSAFGNEILIILKVEDADNDDGHVYFKTKELIHRRKNQKARIWWIMDFCTKIN